MPLTSRTPGQSPIDSSAVNQFVQLLTGVMSDQAVGIANTFTATNTITGSSNAIIAGTLSLTGVGLLSFAGNVTGTIRAGTGSLVFQPSSGGVNHMTLANSGGLSLSSGFMTTVSTATSSQRTAYGMGSSGPNIQFGSSIPTSAAVAGSIFLNAGGSSTTCLYVAVQNAGSASSSNWSQFTMA